MPAPLCRPVSLPADPATWTAEDFRAAIGSALPRRGWLYAGEETRKNFACEWCGQPPRARVVTLLEHPKVSGRLACCRLCALILCDANFDEIEQERYRRKDGAISSTYRGRAVDLRNWFATGTPGGILIRPDRYGGIQIEPGPDGLWHWRVRVGRSVTGEEQGPEKTIEAAFAVAVQAWRDLDYADRLEAEAAGRERDSAPSSD